MVRRVVEVVLLLASGIYDLLKNADRFEDLETGVYDLVRRATLQLLEHCFERIDQRLMAKRGQKFRVVGFRQRSMLSPFGEIRIRRRYYVDEHTGRRCFLLDEAMGLGKGDRVTPWLKKVAVRLAVDMSYHRAADLLKTLRLCEQQGSAMMVWREVQAAGRAARDAADRDRSAIFDRGEAPGGTRVAQSLDVEADEVWVPARTRCGKRRKTSVKVAVAYEGKRLVEKDRRELVNKRVICAVSEPDRFWEETVAGVGRIWDLGSVGRCNLGTDGASWLKKGCEYLPNASHRLDAYHLRRALIQALGHDEPAYQEVSDAVRCGDWTRVDTCLYRLQRSNHGGKRSMIHRLRRYLESNWDGIRGSGKAQSLGAIEGQVFHNVARRMKRHGARWSESGADHLARALSARANGELGAFTESCTNIDRKMLNRALPQRAVDTCATGGTDDGSWLKVSMPVLQGPSAGKPWVKWVMRALAEAGMDVA